MQVRVQLHWDSHHSTTTLALSLLIVTPILTVVGIDQWSGWGILVLLLLLNARSSLHHFLLLRLASSPSGSFTSSSFGLCLIQLHNQISQNMIRKKKKRVTKCVYTRFILISVLWMIDAFLKFWTNSRALIPPHSVLAKLYFCSIKFRSWVILISEV